MHALLKSLALLLMAVVVSPSWAGDKNDKDALRKERDALRALIKKVQRQAEEKAAESENEWVSETEEIAEENEWVDEEIEEQVAQAEELAEEIAGRIEEHAEAFGQQFEEQMEAASEQLEAWAEEHSSRWEEWAEEYGQTWEAWAEEQEALWTDWSEEYSDRWENWATELEEGNFDQQELSELLEHNIDMLGRMPLQEIYEQLLEAPDHIEQMPLDSLKDLESIVRESVEQAVKGMEEGMADADMDGLSDSLLQLRNAMKVKNSQLDKAAKLQLKEAMRAMEQAKAAQNRFQHQRRIEARQTDREQALLEELVALVKDRSEGEIVDLIEQLSDEREEISGREAEMELLREEIQALRNEIQALRRD